MDILVNNQIKTLSIIDPKTGCDWIADLLGNYDAFDGYDDELPVMSKSNYDWWVDYIAREQDLQDRINAIRLTLSCEQHDTFEQSLIDASDGDIELCQLGQIAVVEQWSNNNG